MHPATRESVPVLIPRLFEDMVERATFAYIKRTVTLANGVQSLRVLSVFERPIELMLATSRYYRETALDVARTMYELSRPSHKEASAFVIVAIEQTLSQGTNQATLWSALYLKHPQAVRNALWFYGAPSICDALLMSPSEQWRRLGIELSGLMTQQQHAAAIEAIPTSELGEPEKLKALGRLDVTGRTVSVVIPNWLANGTPEQTSSALEFLCVSGIKVSASLLKASFERSMQNLGVSPLAADNLDITCALLCIHYPGDEGAGLLTRTDIPSDLYLRCMAILGMSAVLLPVFAEMDCQKEPLSQSQRELLFMIFGVIPVELAERPGDPMRRSVALKILAAEVFQANGCATITAAKLADWDIALINGPLWPMAQVRLRNGKPRSKRLDISLMREVSHRMRRWLYAEYAASSGRVFPLSANDRASRQTEVLRTLEVVSELLDPQ